MKKTGLWLMAFAIVLAFVETLYFGSNWIPASNAEWACDIFLLNLFLFGLVLVVDNIKIPIE